MSDIAALVADSLDIWTGAIERKSGAGRGGGKRISLYGIDRLRALILDLAVRGKLVPQDAGDEPASDLLKSIESKKPGYLSTHGLPKQRAIAEPLKHLPFELPPSWAWTRLGDIAAYIQRGKSPRYSEGSGIFVVSQRCVQWAGLDLAVAKEISRPSLDSYEPYRFLGPDDLLWNSTGTGTIGRVIALKHVPDGLVCDSHVTVVRCPWMNARYLQFWLASNDVYGQIEVLAAGSTNQIEWTAQLAAAQVVPVPPMAEQQRIVAKVDELMALCDALERDSVGTMAAHQALVEILLATLVNSADATDPARDWARLERHFDTLFTTDASIDALKQTILDLAVRGVLVSGMGTKEASGNAVSLAAKAKRALSEAEGLRARRPIIRGKLARPEDSFPSHWTFTDFDSVFVTVSGVAKGQKIPSNQSVDAPYLRVANVQRGQLNLDEIKIITVKQSDFERYQLRQGDVLMTEGGDWDKLGRAAIWGNEVPNCIHQNHVFRVRFDQSVILPEWVVLFLNSPLGREYFSRAAKQTTNLASINMTQLRSCPVPIPAYAEQRRIVAKVDALMALCDALKARLADAAQTQRHLADAITQRAAA